MADGTKIEWTDATWNPITGCSVHGPGCANCYAMKLAGTRLQHHPSREGLTVPTKAGPVWNGQVRFNEDWLTEPLRWKRPRRIFVVAHGDLFHEAVPDAWIDQIFAVMALCPQHQFQVLTKRADRMREYMLESDSALFGRLGLIQDAAYRLMAPIDGRWNEERGVTARTAVRSALGERGGFSNIWLGVTIVNQVEADRDVPKLLATPAAKRFLSMEPLLGSVNLWQAGAIVHHFGGNVLGSDDIVDDWDESKLDWVIVGGESGPGARPMHPDWARSLRDQCAAAGVPFLFKQWGEWGVDDGPPSFGPDRIFNGETSCAVLVDGNWRHFENGYRPPVELCTGHGEWVYRLGKKRAGRLLDGVQHDGFPA
jgi:protein gp37